LILLVFQVGEVRRIWTKRREANQAFDFTDPSDIREQEN